jgi:predicted RNA binding protein YcfA (HicA-like mRNA interferase family)
MWTAVTLGASAAIQPARQSAGRGLWKAVAVPMKVGEIIAMLEGDGWTLKRTTGSHRHYTHPDKPGLVTVAGKPSATLKPGTEASILRQAGLRKERR